MTARITTLTVVVRRIRRTEVAETSLDVAFTT
jgi:hypothetical protein